MRCFDIYYSSIEANYNTRSPTEGETMQKRMVIVLLGVVLWATGCASGSGNSPAASTATAASNSSSTQTGDSQDRDARIKESDAVRRSMGY